MVKFAHISDIHFGAVDENAAKRLAAQINDQRVDAVIVTGDLTQAGRKKEFQAAAEYLAQFSAPILVVPGNHDVPVYNLARRFADPWSRFQKYLTPDLCPTLHIGDALILGLNSARRAGASLDWSLGRLSRKQLDHAAAALRANNTATLKLVAFHHPVLPGPGRAGRAVINNPRRALQSLAAAGADLVLTGHAHVAEARIHETTDTSLIVTAAGTATSTRLRGELPSYNLLSHDDQGVKICIHRYTEEGFAVERSVAFYRDNGLWRNGDAP